MDVRKEISFCRKVEMPIIGVVENMSSFICPHCKVNQHILYSYYRGLPFLSIDLHYLKPVIGDRRVSISYWGAFMRSRAYK